MATTAVEVSDGSVSPNGTHPDLLRERGRATFSPLVLTHLLDGGSASATNRRRHLESLIENDPSGVFSNEDNPFLHRRERHVRALAKHVRLIELCRSIGIGNDCEGGDIIRSPDFPTLVGAVADDLPTSLHWIMFVPNICTLADEEQKREWLPLCRDWRMIGCYVQTELGHGSNVRALETTATFCSEANGGHHGGSWVVNSPTLTATKFWPGTLGRTCNHAMVIARLIDGEGVDRGVHNFLVQTRNMDDHSLMSGVVTGDIGPKIGYNNMDNGFAIFKNVLIPRRNMAMRFATVDESGVYKKAILKDAASKVAYITMMQVRAHIVNEAGKALAMACTIVIRYSAVRRQGFSEEVGSEGSEMQILDYKQQQHRLFPLLAASYCFFFTGKKVISDLNAIEKRIVSGRGGITKTEVGDIHASTSSLKSFTSTVAADGIEDCRKACGGHGYLHCSGLPELLTTYLQNPTVEGDNHMLPQQVVKVLLKLVQAVESKDEQSIAEWNSCDARYLVNPVKSMLSGDAPAKCDASHDSSWMEFSVILAAFQHRAARLLVEVAQQIQEAVMDGASMQSAWNVALVQMARVSRAHSLYLLLRNFAKGIEEESSKKTLGPCEVAVLMDLALLFGLYWIEKDIGDFLEDGYMNAEQARCVRSSVLAMLEKVRPNAVALVDARDFSDFRLKSALGRYDGNVYPAILESAKRDPLNATEPGPGYEQHLKRLIVDGVGKYTGTISRL